MKTLSDSEIELIEKYIDNSLSDEESNLFQQKIQQSIKFSDQLELAQKAINDIKEGYQALSKKELFEIYHQSKKDRQNKVRFNNRTFIAASVSLLMLCMFYWYGSYYKANDTLYYAYYEVYPATPSARGGHETTNLAMDYYRMQNYKEALMYFAPETFQDEDQLMLYTGNCYLNLNEEKRAIETFTQGLESKDQVVRNYAKWYLALSYLKDKQPEKAKNELSEIVKENQIYSEEASSLLEQIR